MVGDVFKFAPADLTPGELLVLLRLAENAPERTRIARFITAESIAEDTRLSYGTVRNALSELAKRGLIVRQFEHARAGRAQDYALIQLAEHHRRCTRTAWIERPQDAV